jgi:type I restriction enzyme S subunit
LFDFNYRTNLPNIFYWLTQNSVTDYLHQLAEQSTSAYPSIKSIDIENLSIIIPKSIKEQKAIAQILTAFDDKIELLQAQNKTLETTAQTIFILLY